MAAFLYAALLTIAYPFYRLAALFPGRLREFHRTRVAGRMALAAFFSQEPIMPTVWLHGSSAGELDQALAVARELRQRGEVRILLTVFSLSVKKLPFGDCDVACYLPLDLPWTWRCLTRGPDFFATFTWDVFPHLLSRLHRLGTRSYLVSAALPGDSWRLRHAGHMQSFYRHLDGISTVDEINRQRFLQLYPHPDRVQATGDTRYDTIFHRLEKATLAETDAARLQACRPLLILASTYRSCDEELLPDLGDWMRRHGDLDVWIFPHHVDEHRLRECEEGLAARGLHAIRYSALPDPRPHVSKSAKAAARKGAGRIVHTDGASHPRLVLVDRLGLLARWYSKARYCYVGGGFHNRIHNTAEPAALGALTLTGPRIEDSPIALQLEEAGTLFRCRSGAEVFAHLDRLEGNARHRSSLAARARRLLQNERGAARRFLRAFSL